MLVSNSMGNNYLNYQNRANYKYNTCYCYNSGTVVHVSYILWFKGLRISICL